MSKEPAANTYVAIVEDDESLCRSFNRLLRAVGFQAITYTSAEAFLADAKRPRFDCLLLDIQLHGMSGLELHRQLATLGSVTPVIFITAHEDPATKLLATAAAGCAGYFRKAEAGQTVINAIKQVVSAARNKFAPGA